MPGRREKRLGHICITIIGIGYLFPISAIWAAFDYWEVLFPGQNIEFPVSVVYQVGSVLTVALLSLSHKVQLGPRIMGGFSGQFLCLGGIFAFRWLTISKAVLLNTLFALVALCSVATGYLDSALLALCSQYTSEMQQYLQIGIGLGTLVSVLYRDVTKLVLSGDVADATSMYFAVALVTVLICITSYKMLMRLPMSKHIRMKDGGTVDEGDLPFAFTFTPTPSTTPHEGEQDAPLLGVEKTVSIDDPDCSFSHVLGKVWKNQVVIFLNLFLTTLCYPGLITSIPCREYIALRGEGWFQTLLLTSFTISDIIARFMTHFRIGLNHKNIWLTVVVRAVIFPIMVFCITNPASHDIYGFMVCSAFGFLNGYCVSLSLIVVNEIPDMSDEQRKTSGRMAACFVNSGLCMGSVAAAFVAPALGLGKISMAG